MVMEGSTPTRPFWQFVRAAAVEEEEVKRRRRRRRRQLQQAEVEEGQVLTVPLSATRTLATIPAAANGEETPGLAAAA